MECLLLKVASKLFITSRDLKNAQIFLSHHIVCEIIN
jgi:hypothetical protein